MWFCKFLSRSSFACCAKLHEGRNDVDPVRNSGENAVWGQTEIFPDSLAPRLKSNSKKYKDKRAELLEPTV